MVEIVESFEYENFDTSIALETRELFTWMSPHTPPPSFCPTSLQGHFTVGGNGSLLCQKFFRSTETSCSFSGVSSSSLALSYPSRRRV